MANGLVIIRLIQNKVEPKQSMQISHTVCKGRGGQPQIDEHKGMCQSRKGINNHMNGVQSHPMASFIFVSTLYQEVNSLHKLIRYLVEGPPALHGVIYLVFRDKVKSLSTKNVHLFSSSPYEDLRLF